MTFLAVVGLHVLAISALILVRFVPPLIKPAETPLTWIVEPPPEQPPPESQPTVARVNVPVVQMPVIDPPDIVLMPVEAVPLPVPDGQSLPVEQVAPVGVATVVAPVATQAPTRVTTELQYRMTRPTDDYYPDTSKQLEEQGVAIVRVCVDASGKMTGKPVVQTSSGYSRLDKAAVRWASDSLRFTPATVDGIGVAACKGFRVNFDLH
jgi:TonB family protein